MTPVIGDDISNNAFLVDQLRAIYAEENSEVGDTINQVDECRVAVVQALANQCGFVDVMFECQDDLFVFRNGGECFIFRGGEVAGLSLAVQLSAEGRLIAHAETIFIVIG
ncbi:hypothetical protein D9M69_663800 [compost metagenome]